MEISKLKVIGNKVYFRIVCQTCKKEVWDSDKFCRNCGRKLEQLDRVVNVEDVVSILTDVFKGRKADQHKADTVSNEGELIWMGSSTSGDADKVEDTKESTLGFSPHRPCPRNKESKCGCEFLQADGDCHGMCFPTNPPQYPKCVYFE